MIDSWEKQTNILGGHAWRHIHMACSKLEAMAIYLIKQFWGNHILSCVYVLCRIPGTYVVMQNLISSIWRVPSARKTALTVWVTEVAKRLDRKKVTSNKKEILDLRMHTYNWNDAY